MNDWPESDMDTDQSRREMLRPVVFSGLFHILVVLVFAIGWPFLSDRDPLAQPLVIVDMVTIVPETNLESSPQLEEKQAAKKPEAPKKAPQPAPKIEQASSLTPPPPPPPPPPPAPTPPAPPPPAPVPPASAEILPDKKVATPLARPKAKPAPPEPVKVATPVARPKPPVKKPVPKPKPAARDNRMAKESQQKQKRQEALTGVLQNLAKAQTARQDKDQETDRKKKASQALSEALAKAASQAKPPEEDSTDKTDDLAAVSQAVQQAVRAPQPAKPQKLGISELDLLRNHIASCWQPPIGAAGASELKVDIFVRLEKDGSVLEASIEDTSRYRSDRFFRAAANSALRAVLDCSPLPLPAEKFDLWREFIFGFDPRFIAG